MEQGMNICSNITEAIGNTPLIKIESLSKATGCLILAKAEFMNPGGSIKDRAARHMIQQAVKNGELQQGGWIVEATSGNTGLGISLVALTCGYKFMFCIPSNKSPEKIDILRTMGAEVILCTPGLPKTDDQHYHNVARAKAKELGGLYVNQYYNKSNWQAHYETSGPEIWQQTAHKITHFVTAPGTGGTLGGISRYLKDQDPKIEIIALNVPGSSIEPATTRNEDGTLSFVLKKEAIGTTILEGIGPDSMYLGITESKVDKYYDIDNEISVIHMMKYLLKHDGLFLGGSGAYNVLGAYLQAKKSGPGGVIVTVLCDHGSKYITTLWDNKFLKEKGIELKESESDTLELSLIHI
eukprot:TRINITY_DN900_c0_g1_i4.p1 TRINITY_DN900_c0_g1~~TRINITY_DN900_c0_g1_i4.p1  ORF type:complete len:364 (-),score=70.73 TRINITY_DN900_c0_g1_i4:29-1087(-)